jgi:N4-gp56 family major capsid protein
LATQKTDSSGLAPEVRVIYDRNLLARLLPSLVWLLFGTPKPMPRNAGQSVQFRRFLSLPLATTPLTEGVTPSPDDLQMSTLSAQPAQYGKYVEVSDLLDMTAVDPIIVETGQLQGEQAGQTIDAVVRDQIMIGTTVQYAGTGHVARNQVTSSDKLTAAELRKAVRTLKKNNVRKITQMVNASTGVGTTPVNSCFVAIVDADTEFDIKQDVNWKSIETYAQAVGTLLPNEIGAIEEVRFMTTGQGKVFSGAGAAGADVHATLVLAQNAFGVINPTGVTTIVQPFGSGGTADPLAQRATIGWKAYFCAVILEQLAMLRIEHATS